MKIEPTGVKLLPRYTGPGTSEGAIIVKRSADRKSINPCGESTDRTVKLKAIHDRLRLLYAIKAVEAYCPAVKVRSAAHKGALIDIYV